MFARANSRRYATAVIASLVIRSLHGDPCIRVGGSIDQSCAAGFAEALCRDVLALAGPALAGSARRLELELDELELCDGLAVAEAVNALRALSERAPLVVWHAPQLLAHTLYKAGLLREGRLELEAVRDEEATSS